MADALPTRSDLAAAINAGLSLYEMGQRLGHPSLTIARLLYGHYTQAVSLEGLEDYALRHYMGLRRDATRLCQKNGLSPLVPRKEGAEQMSPRLNPETLAELTRESLAADLEDGFTVDEMARVRNVTEVTILRYLARHGLREVKPRGHRTDANQGADASQSPAEVPGAAGPPETSNESSDPVTDKPAPESGSGRGVGEGVGLALTGSQILGGTISSAETAAHAIKFPTTTFAAQINQEGIDIRLIDTGLSPAEVRQYLRVAEGPLELAGEGLEVHLEIRGPRR